MKRAMFRLLLLAIIALISTNAESKPVPNYWVIPYGSFTGKIIIFETWDNNFNPAEMLMYQEQGIHKEWYPQSFIYDVNTKTVERESWKIGADELMLEPPIYLHEINRLVTNYYNWKEDPGKSCDTDGWIFRVYKDDGTLDYTYVSHLDVPTLMPTNSGSIVLSGERCTTDDPFANVVWNVEQNTSTEPVNLNKYRFWMRLSSVQLREHGNTLYFKGNPKDDYDSPAFYKYNIETDTVIQILPLKKLGVFFDMTSDYSTFSFCYQNDDKHYIELFKTQDASLEKRFEHDEMSLNYSLRPASENVVFLDESLDENHSSDNYDENPDIDVSLYDWDGNKVKEMAFKDKGWTVSNGWIDKNNFFILYRTKSNRDILRGGSIFEAHDAMIIDLLTGETVTISNIIAEFKNKKEL